MCPVLDTGEDSCSMVVKSGTEELVKEHKKPVFIVSSTTASSWRYIALLVIQMHARIEVI